MAEEQQTEQKSAAYMQKKARQEAEGVRYVRAKIDWNNPKLVAQVYENLLKQNMFETPVGLEFLAEIRQYLEEQKQKEKRIEKEREKIRQTPQKPDFVAPDGTEKQVESLREEKSEAAKETAQIFVDQNVEKKSETASEIRQKQKKNKEPKREKSVSKNEKKWLHLSVAGNIFLIVIVLLMFWITSTSENPTILDYETKIVNKYETWQNQLQEKEKELQQREKKLQESEESLQKRADYLENGNEG